MLIYLLILSVASFFSFSRGLRTPPSYIQVFLVFIFTIYIGFRHEVGGDWNGYQIIFERASHVPLLGYLASEDPGYALLNYTFRAHPLGIYLVNAFSALIFSVGLITFCSHTPRFWLALTLSLPYLTTVVSLGYTRQSVAIGLLMLAFVSLEKARIFFFILFTLFASLFHSSSVLLLGLLFPFIPSRTKLTLYLRLLLSFFLLLATAQSLLSAHYHRFISSYIENSFQSDGALIRVLMCLIPASLYLLYRRRFNFTPTKDLIWFILSCSSILLFSILLVFPSNSTLVDRIALYLLPLQLVVGATLPSTGFISIPPVYISFLVILYSIIVQLFWLFFANHASFWIPYQNLLFL